MTLRKDKEINLLWTAGQTIKDISQTEHQFGRSPTFR